MEYKITSACTKCEACITVCPTSSILMGQRHFVIDSDTCDGNAVCVKVCKDAAIVPVDLDEKALRLQKAKQKK